MSLGGLIGAGVIAFGFKLPARAGTRPEALVVDRATSPSIAPAAPPRAAAVAAAALAMERRDLRVVESASARRREAAAAGASTDIRRPPADSRRRVSPRRAVSQARRDP